MIFLVFLLILVFQNPEKERLEQVQDEMIQIQVDDGVTFGLSKWMKNSRLSFKNNIVMLFTCLYIIHVIFFWNINTGKNCFSYILYGIKHLLIKFDFFLKFAIWPFFINFIQIRYQKEIDRLIKENKDLRKSLMLKEPKSGRKRTMRVCKVSHSMQISFYCSHLYQYKNPFNIIVVPPWMHGSILVTSLFHWKCYGIHGCTCIFFVS